MVDDRNIGFKSRKIRRNETGIYNVFVEWWGGWQMDLRVMIYL
jgi:hypothetical protein